MNEPVVTACGECFPKNGGSAAPLYANGECLQCARCGHRYEDFGADVPRGWISFGTLAEWGINETEAK